ncbi:dimethylarginine dimethylaminohydrolase family protein [Alkalicoccus luteus]|uniref:dimethylarginine dimethylaminohydrolase family protein n=1 Tax=Alkalicoccus luteus TaxID=1237094 RepID=UPI004034C59E
MVKVQGERWFPSEKTFSEEMTELWGDWYCDSEVGRLRSVLMHRPGPEIDGITDEIAADVRFRGAINAEKARAEHDAMADVYRDHGVEVHYVCHQRTDRPNAMFMRDLMLMTPEGAIVSRPAVPSRRGEEKAVARTLADLGVPIIKTINGRGFFEGACAMWIDRETVVLGSGSRANKEGIRQVETELKNMGVETILHTPIPYGSIHLDGYMNMVDRHKLAVFPWHLAYDTAQELQELGIELIEVTDIDEIKQGMALNVVALEPGHILMPAGCPNTRQVYENAGITVTEVELGELMKGWGAVHCTTAFLKRDPL